MVRLTAVNPDNATGKTKELFNAIEGRMGMVPNMMRTMGNSPALLEGMLNFNAALSSGTLSPKTGELISLAVAESNGCDYCVAAHTFFSIAVMKMDAETIDAAKKGNAADAKTTAVLQFAKTLIDKRGLVNDADVAAVKNAGATEGEIAEIVGHVALNILTNYFNNTANTEIDPAIKEFMAATV